MQAQMTDARRRRRARRSGFDDRARAATRSTPTGSCTSRAAHGLQDAMKERLLRAYLERGRADRRPRDARAARASRPASPPTRSASCWRATATPTRSATTSATAAALGITRRPVLRGRPEVRRLRRAAAGGPRRRSSQQAWEARPPLEVVAERRRLRPRRLLSGEPGVGCAGCAPYSSRPSCSRSAWPPPRPPRRAAPCGSPARGWATSRSATGSARCATPGSSDRSSRAASWPARGSARRS